MGVKGSWSRVQDHKRYRENWERIYGKKKECAEKKSVDKKDESAIIREKKGRHYE